MNPAAGQERLAPVVVIVEDEPQIRRFVRAALESEGCTVWEADTAARGLIEAGTRKPDLLVLDLGLPDGDGVDLIRDLRNWSGVPVLVLSARSDESDKVAALDAGGDDYLTKPFGIPELLARVRALLRRAGRGGDMPPVFAFGPVEVDLARRQVSRHGEAVHLTPIEYRLLSQLVANAGRVLTHTASCCGRCGAPAMWSTPITCGCTWPACGASWRTTRPCRGTSSPNPASATGWRCNRGRAREPVSAAISVMSAWRVASLLSLRPAVPGPPPWPGSAAR